MGLEFLLMASAAYAGLHNPPKFYLESLQSDSGLDAVVNSLDSDSIEQKVANVYYFLQANVPYVPDPKEIDLIRTPIDTYTNGGDCEDLALLSIELLRELNVNSYFVLSERHAFALVGPVDEYKLLDVLPKGYRYNITGYYFDDGLYVYFDAAVRGNGAYPGFVSLEHLGSAVIADVETKEIIRIIGKELEIKK